MTYPTFKSVTHFPLPLQPNPSCATSDQAPAPSLGQTVPWGAPHISPGHRCTPPPPLLLALPTAVMNPGKGFPTHASTQSLPMGHQGATLVCVPPLSLWTLCFSKCLPPDPLYVLPSSPRTHMPTGDKSLCVPPGSSKLPVKAPGLPCQEVC